MTSCSFHRGLHCLVGFELKTEKFKRADLGQLSFYVEALDRDVRKAHERPSIGVLLCATKDDEVVEYALARTTSPTLVAEYQTFLPPKEVLRAKLHIAHEQLAVLRPNANAVQDAQVGQLPELDHSIGGCSADTKELSHFADAAASHRP